MRVLAKGERNITPLKAFDEDLSKHLAQLHAKGDIIILAGDFNCTVHDSRIRKIQEKFSLTKIMAFTNPNTTPTSENGTKTIDHILVSTPLLGVITKAEYIRFKYGVYSDYRTLVLDLDTQAL